MRDQGIRNTMSDIAIRVEGLGKQYRIGGKQARYKTLRDSLADAVSRPFRAARSLIARNGNRTDRQETIWALKDVSFEVKRGEVLGIIGRNAAGKSTLLKILSRITEPTEGFAEIHGRVGSLLEVGTGFHPELTGRENIYLNGAILGMKKSEIERKFDDIVGFAEVEEFTDTPVKHYSSGMYVRLAFAVAAHLEPEILLVDEVLAVGDAAFQKKCLGKIGDVAKGGRTVLFVTHNMLAVKTMCNRVILLGGGRLLDDSYDVNHGITLYSGLRDANMNEWSRDTHVNGKSSEAPLIFTHIRHELEGAQPNHTLRITAEIQSLRPHSPAFIAFDILDAMAIPLLQAIPTQIPFLEYSRAPQQVEVAIKLPPLVPGAYQLTAWLGSHYNQTFDLVETVLTFEITESPQWDRTCPHSPDHGFLVPESTVTYSGQTGIAPLVSRCI